MHCKSLNFKQSEVYLEISSVYLLLCEDMSNIIQKLWNNRSIFRNLFHSIYFNFHYLPLAQAIKLPILLYKPHFISLKGKVGIDSPNIRTGMIRLGFRTCNIYPNSGISWENLGGNVRFQGGCIIGNDSYLSFGTKTNVYFGDDFRNTAGLKLVSSKGIKFGRSTSLGWGVLVMDTNFHPLYDMVRKVYKRASGEIEIGDYNWFGTQCKIMHSVKTPERCIFGMNTVVTRNCTMKSYCVMGGDPVRVFSENVMRDYDNDKETY